MTIKLSEQQQQAYDEISKFVSTTGTIPLAEDDGLLRFEDPTDGYRSYVVSGYAGTGKTQLLSSLADKFQNKVLLAAPTHKARKVLQSKMSSDTVVHTIHSLFYTHPADMLDTLVKRLDAPEITAKEQKRLRQEIHNLRRQGNSLSFVPRSVWDLDIKTIIVDEASMVNQEMVDIARSLGLSMVFFGDGGQLPPVRAEKGVDLDVADITLTKIFRTAEESPIPHIAEQIRQASPKQIMDILAQAKKDHPATFDDSIEKGMHITWTNKSRQAINAREAKHGLRFVADQRYIVHQGGDSLVNSDMVTVKEILSEKVEGNPFLKEVVLRLDGADKDRTMLVSTTDIDPLGGSKEYDVESIRANKKAPSLALPYAITCHKSQGSEFNDVRIHHNNIARMTFMTDDDKRKWFYTAVTRSKDRLAITAV